MVGGATVTVVMMVALVRLGAVPPAQCHCMLGVFLTTAVLNKLFITLRFPFVTSCGDVALTK